MNRILVIGAGGVGSTVVHKCRLLPGLFTEIGLASRSLEKCEAVRQDSERPLFTAAVDASSIASVTALLRDFQPRLVINCALPEHNLVIMEACLQAGVHYIDTSAPEPDPRRYEMFAYRWQLAFREKFRQAGLTALLSMGFDPGVTNIFCSYAAKHLFDEIHSIDILDCNSGSHGLPFATNFNPTVNIQEVIQKGVYWKDGKWKEVEPFSVQMNMDLPEIGRHRMYLIYHEELETLVERIPGIRQARFWMHFNDSYLNHLEVLRNVGLTSLEPVEFNGTQVVPLDFLARLLPDPASLAPGYSGKTNIGCLFKGIKDGHKKTCYLYNVCDHAVCYREIKTQAISYTTAIPAVLAAKLLLDTTWQAAGVHLPEELDPDPFMQQLPDLGLPWTLEENPQMV
jgi:saccharopine dehydrogenase (NAD+, L-lysine-forming)